MVYGIYNRLWHIIGYGKPMTISQLFFAMAGLSVTVAFGLAGFIKYYMDAKIDPIAGQVKQLVDYMILHEGKIATLQERTKHL